MHVIDPEILSDARDDVAGLPSPLLDALAPRALRTLTRLAEAETGASVDLVDVLAVDVAVLAHEGLVAAQGERDGVALRLTDAGRDAAASLGAVVF